VLHRSRLTVGESGSVRRAVRSERPWLPGLVGALNRRISWRWAGCSKFRRLARAGRAVGRELTRRHADIQAAPGVRGMAFRKLTTLQSPVVCHSESGHDLARSVAALQRSGHSGCHPPTQDAFTESQVYRLRQYSSKDASAPSASSIEDSRTLASDAQTQRAAPSTPCTISKHDLGDEQTSHSIQEECL
jgi:hypothetical protein